MKKRFLTISSMLLATTCAMASAPEQPAITPDTTNQALLALLRSQDAFLPKTSPSPMKCYGLYPTVAEGDEPRIRDLLANMMGEMFRGKNTIEGFCQGTGCHLNMYHSYGEDLSSMEIVFDTINGVADPSSLECNMSP